MNALTRRRCARLGASLLAVAGTACDPEAGFHVERPEERAPLATIARSGAANRPPVVRDVRIEPGQPSVEDRLRAEAIVGDAEGDATEISYRWSVNGVIAGENEAEFDLGGVSKGSRVEVHVTASDSFATGNTLSAEVRVIDRAPVMSGVAIAPTQSVYPGDNVVVTPTATDPDGDFVDFEFEWFVNDDLVGSDGRSFSSTGLAHGDRIRVRVVATDGANESRAFESQDVVVESAHPEFVSSPPGFTDAGIFRYAVEARDPDGDRNLRYRLAEAPDGMKIDEVLGVVEWRPGEGQMGVHPVAVVVSDSSRLQTTQRFQVTVSGPGPAAADTAP